MRALLAGARRKQSALLHLAQQLVAAESPSDGKAAVDVCVALVAAHAKALVAASSSIASAHSAICSKHASGQNSAVA